jgi:cytoskeleton protein RodZ
MSDSNLTPVPQAPEVSAIDAPPAVPAALPTAGQMLHNARRAVGLSLEELAERVKVPVARLQALEEDRFDGWPDMNVVRAVAASVCRHVRLDSAIILARLPKAEKMVWSAAVADSPVGFRDKDGFKMRSASGVGRLPLALLALALALAALGLYLGPMLQDWFERVWANQPPSTTAPAPVAVPEPVLPPDAGPTDTRVGAVAPEAPASLPVAGGALAGASTATPGAIVSVAPLQAAPFKTSADASVVGTVAVPPANTHANTNANAIPLLVFKARGLTWVAVTDAKGVSLLRKTLAAGETANANAASAALPLWVVVGRADKIDVEVRGQRLKLEPSAPDNVARFKVQ